ncbi:MAG: hypothetical protein CSA11_07020 [Chloroflexi bacterium]|nr:MAG: hypothetical protein CSA11_07020 [Chloroflexota bacterium]
MENRITSTTELETLQTKTILSLDELVQQGAKRMLEAALAAEVEAYIHRHQSERDAAGQAQVVRNGKSRERTIHTGAGSLTRHRCGHGFFADNRDAITVGVAGRTANMAETAVIPGQPLGHRRTRERIGYLPEHFRFHEWLTAAELLNLHGRFPQLPFTQRSRKKHVTTSPLFRVATSSKPFP